MSDAIRFSADDLDLFRDASHDRNPLHLSDDYARRTPFGARVTYGALGVVAALGRLRPSPPRSLASLEAHFQGAMLANEAYHVEITEDSPEAAELTVRDGRRGLLNLSARFAQGAPRRVPGPAPSPPRPEAARRGPAELAGLRAEGSYAPEPAALARLLARHGLADRGLDPAEVGVLLFASYLVGMEIPGERALFSRLQVDFEGDARSDSFAYQASVAAFDARFDLVRAGAELFAGDQRWARLALGAFLRPESFGSDERPTPQPSSALGGKVAVITGASRGLGAALAEAVAFAGGVAVVNFHRSRDAAELLLARCAGAPGRVELTQGDAGDAAYWRSLRGEIAARHGRLDALVCNACPPLRSLWLEEESSDRVASYVGSSTAMTSAPMASLLPMVDEARGSCVVISSSAVSNPPAEWPHYIAAKFALEGLARVAAAEYPKTRMRIVRPPALLTDLLSTPLARRRAVAPEHVAARIVDDMVRSDGERVAVVEGF